MTTAPPAPAFLLPQHQQLIRESAISPEVAAARGYRSVTDRSELAPLGFSEAQRRVPCLLVPIRDVQGRIALHQIRPDTPRLRKGKPVKYDTPTGAQLVLDVPPPVRSALGDPAIPLWITEGSRKADAAVSKGLACIALLGVWGWRGTGADGGKTVLADWESIALNSRDVYLAFDSDVVTKPEVHEALSRLQAFLTRRGAKVHLAHLPSGMAGAKVGLDDYFAAGHGVDDLLGLVSDELPLSHRPTPASAARPENASTTAAPDDVDGFDASDTFDDLPSFPMDTLSPTAARLVQHFAAAVEATPDLVVPALLAALSAALGPEWKVGARSFIRPALLWFVLVASSGMSKTPATKPLLAPLHAEDRRLGEIYKAAHRAYARALRDWNRARKGDTEDKPEEPLRPRAAITDVTSEGIVAALDASPKGLLVHSDEVAQLLNSLDAYHARPGRGRATFLSLWSGTRIAEARKTAKQSEADDPFAVIFGGIQQAVLCQLQLEDGDGLCARFLFSIVRGTPGGLGQHIHPDAVDLWNKFIALAQGHRVKLVQFFDEGGQELLDQKLRSWRQQAADLDDAGSGLLASMYGKAGDHCVRLTAVLHAMDAIEAALAQDKDAPPPLVARTVPRATVARAVRLVAYYIAHGSTVARLVVRRPADPEVLLAGDRDLMRHLRAIVGPGEDVIDSPTGWRDRLVKRGVKVSATKLGKAMVRLEAGAPAGLRIERQQRGGSRGWRVFRVAKASEATEASGSPDSGPWSAPDASDSSDGGDGGRSPAPNNSPTLPTPAPPSDGTEGDPSATAAVASDTSDASSSGSPPDSAECWSGTRRLVAAEHAEGTIRRALRAGDEGTAWWAARELAAVVGIEQAEAVAEDIRSELKATADAG